MVHTSRLGSMELRKSVTSRDEEAQMARTPQKEVGRSAQKNLSASGPTHIGSIHQSETACSLGEASVPISATVQRTRG